MKSRDVSLLCTNAAGEVVTEKKNDVLMERLHDVTNALKRSNERERSNALEPIVGSSERRVYRGLKEYFLVP